MKYASLDKNDISATDTMKLLLEFINSGEVTDLNELRQLRRDAKFMVSMLEEEIMVNPEYLARVEASENVSLAGLSL